MNIEQARFNMIEQQIRPWDVLDTHVLQLLAAVKREDFCALAHKALAFVDMEIPLGHGASMLSPKVEARLLQDLAVQKHEKSARNWHWQRLHGRFAFAPRTARDQP